MKTPIEPKKNVLKDVIYSSLGHKPIELEDRFHDPEEDEFLYRLKWDSDSDGFMSRRRLRQDKYGKRRQGWND